VWHLTNGEALSWAELARRACAAAGVSSEKLQEVSIGDCGYVAPRPGYSALGSERGLLMPSLDDALMRYVEAVQERANGISLGHEQAGEAAHYAR
ncbi:sugar nucleotide-binding protein, partial [Acinetobacter baumannii]|nr:sugar nucleotide-binding protein [Acinetobacter baumannii]